MEKITHSYRVYHIEKVTYSYSYMIKQLLTNLWVYWRKAENLAVTESYAVAKLNMNPHGFNY